MVWKGDGVGVWWWGLESGTSGIKKVVLTQADVFCAIVLLVS